MAMANSVKFVVISVVNQSQESAFLAHIQVFVFNQHVFFHSAAHKEGDRGVGKPVTQAES
jgi:hypothetical protein